jgi:hypothetical protein
LEGENDGENDAIKRSLSAKEIIYIVFKETKQKHPFDAF